VGSETLKDICPTCGKRRAGGSRLGSLTGFLFGASNCACSLAGKSAKAGPVSPGGPAADEIDFCPKCGLQIVSEARDGSLTGYMFQSTRCKCPPDQAFADGKMSSRFWKLKEAGAGTIFMGGTDKGKRAGNDSIDLVPGAIIGGVYKIVQLIGRGGMGEVYLARHEALGKKCALKVIPPEQVTEIGWQRFQLEAKAVAKLDHINLVRVTDLGIHEGCLPFYAMDYVEGQNLAEALAEHGPMPIKTMLEIFMQVCDGVECAHRSGILHRDLKPANIMVVENKSGLKQAKVLDFGLAKLTKHDRGKQSLTALGDIFGSPFYMSPEQCNGDKLDNRSDIYSLGCTMFECLTGQPPFSGHLASAIIFSHLEADPPSLESVLGQGAFPESMEVVMAKLLRKNPVERYQTLSQLKSDLQLIAAGKEVQPVYVSRTKRNLSQNHGDLKAESSPAPSLKAPLLVGFTLLFLAAAGGSFLFLRPAKTTNKIPVLSKSASNPAKSFDAQLFSMDDSMDELSSQIRYAPTIRDQFIVEGKFNAYLRQSLADGTKFLSHDRSVVNFPTQFIIGVISFGDHKPVPATGAIPVIAGEDICFYQNYCLREAPSFLRMFGPEDLAGLELVTFRPLEAIEEIKNWKKLKKLSFFNSLIKGFSSADQEYDQSKLTDRILPVIEQFRNLEVLGLCGAEVSGKQVTQMPLLTKIRSLRLKRIKGMEALLERLPSLDNLEEVWLIGESTTDGQLQYLVRMKNLHSLRILRSALTPGSIKTFRQMPSLKHLSLDCLWEQTAKDQLRAAIPLAQFEPVVDPTYWPILPIDKREQ